MAIHSNDGLSAAERAIRIGEAARDAVKNMPHVALAYGDISNIVARTLNTGNIEESIRQAQSQAVITAQTYMEQQRKANPDADRNAAEAQRLSLNGPMGGMFNMGPLAWRDGGGNGGGVPSGGRSNYQAISYASSQSISGITATSYTGTPFAGAGIQYGTFSYLRGYDRNFTGQDILGSASQNKALGFDVNDRRAMRDQSSIQHYDNNKDATNKALDDYRQRLLHDADLNKLLDERKNATTDAQRKAIDDQIQVRRHQNLIDSGLNSRLSDPKNHPRAKAGIKGQIKGLHDQQDQNRLNANQDMRAERNKTDEQVVAENKEASQKSPDTDKTIARYETTATALDKIGADSKANLMLAALDDDAPQADAPKKQAVATPAKMAASKSEPSDKSVAAVKEAPPEAVKPVSTAQNTKARSAGPTLA